MIEHPVGPDAGFWTVHEVMMSIKEAFDFEQFGEIGQRCYRVFQRWVKPIPRRKTQIIEVEIDQNYASLKKAQQVLDRPKWDITSETSVFQKIMN